MTEQPVVSTPDVTYMVKMRKRASGSRTWYFLSGRGDSYNRLRIHACRFSTYPTRPGEQRSPKERAEAAAREIADLNPEFETKVVKA